MQYKNLFGLSRPARKLAQQLGTFTLQLSLDAKGYTTFSQVSAVVVYLRGGQPAPSWSTANAYYERSNWKSELDIGS